MSTDQTRTHTTPLYARVGDTEITIGSLQVDATREPVRVTHAEVSHPDIADALSTATAQHQPTGELPQLQVLYLPEHIVGEVSRYPFALVASGVPAESASYMRELLQPFAEQVGAVAVLVSLEPLEVI